MSLTHDVTLGRSGLRVSPLRRDRAVIATKFLSKGGLTVNGASSPAWPMSPKHDGDRY